MGTMFRRPKTRAERRRAARPQRGPLDRPTGTSPYGINRESRRSRGIVKWDKQARR